MEAITIMFNQEHVNLCMSQSPLMRKSGPVDIMGGAKSIQNKLTY